MTVIWILKVNKTRFLALLLVVLSLLLLLTMSGCSYEAEVESSADLQEKVVENLISKIPEQLVKLAESKSFVSNLTAKIEQLPNVEQRKKWYYKAQDEVFKIDIAHLQYSQQFRCMRMFTEYLNKISAGSLK